MTAPKRIFLPCYGLDIFSTQAREDEIEYIRADLVKELVEALRVAQGVMHSIRGGRTGSIGSIDNTYLPQLRKDNLDEVSKTIDNILGTYGVPE